MIRIRLEAMPKTLKSRVYRSGDVIVLGDYRDYPKVHAALKGTGLRIRAWNTKGLKVSPTKELVALPAPPKEKFNNPRVLEAADPGRRGNFKQGNPGLIRLPEAVSLEPWPAAWIRKSETEAVKASDAPPWEIRP